MIRSYKVDPVFPEQGKLLWKGWELRLFEDEKEIFGGFFEGENQGYFDAMKAAQDWLALHFD